MTRAPGKRASPDHFQTDAGSWSASSNFRVTFVCSYTVVVVSAILFFFLIQIRKPKKKRQEIISDVRKKGILRPTGKFSFGMIRGLENSGLFMHQSIPSNAHPPPPRATPGHFLMLPVPGVGHLRTSGWPPGIWHMVSKPWSESRIRDGGVYRPRRGLRCRLASPWRTREARGCSWMFLKVYFLNFRYFFIVKKQQLVLYSYITYREI